ncbi:hypothetical protein J4455_04925 [Candidatus Woesearchaeota archaeon]|nr:hypothetical protein [Candidatus Woesearchaeota archaeon]
MRKKQDNTLFIFIILVILLFILPLTFNTPEKLGIQASPPKEALAGSIVLVTLALIIYFSEKTYKYSVD